MVMERRRIVVDLDAAAEDPRALQAAADLAILADAELAGLFIEDANLFRLGGLPFAAEIGIASAAWRPVGIADVERMLTLLAGRLQRRLAETARTLALHWSFEVRRGAALADLLATYSDFVVVAGTARNRVAFNVRVSRRGSEYSQSGGYGPVAVFVETGPGPLRALEAARGLARRRAAELLVVTASGAVDVGAGRRSNDAPAERILQLQSVMPDVLAQALAGAQAVFWPVPSNEGDTRIIESVRSLLDCPVVLVR